MNDIYSLGITFWEIHTRTIPYADFDVHYIIFKVNIKKKKNRI